MASEDIVLVKGDYATFKGYGEEGVDALLAVGQRVVVDKVNPDGGYAVFAVDAEGNAVLGEDGQPIGDTAFPEEVEPEAKAAPAEGDVIEGDVVEGEDTSAPVEQAQDTKPAKPAVKPKMTKAEQKAAAKAQREAEKAAAAAAAQAQPEETSEPAPQQEATPPARTSDSDDPLMINVEQTQSVRAIIAESKDALEAAKMLVNRAEQTDFTLGGVLHNIYVTGVFKTIGYDGKRGFSDYVERELGVAYRKARYLISIYTTFAQVFRAKGITEEDLLRLGWSKAKELARIPVNKLVEDYDALMAMANDSTKSRDDLIQHITTNYEVVQRAEKVTAIKFSFALVADAAEMAKAALDAAKPLTGKENATDNDAFEYIIGDWANTAKGSDMTLDQLIALAEANFGVTLVPAEDGATTEVTEQAEATA